MPASFLATVLIFIVTGVYAVTTYSLGQATSSETFFAVCLSLVILINASFFMYIELYTETDKTTIQKLRGVGLLEWVVRSINQSLLALIWILLAMSPMAAIISLVIFYILLLIWDALVFLNKSFEGEPDGPYPSVVWHDFWGFLLMLCFAWATQPILHIIQIPELALSFIFGILIALFVANVLLALRCAPLSLRGMLDNRI